MRILKSFSIAAMAIALSSCSTLTANQQALLNQIQQGAVTACGFMPTVETVLSLIGGPAGASAAAAISTICGLVAPAGPATGVAAAAPARRFGQTMTARTPDGKEVSGMFVR